MRRRLGIEAFGINAFRAAQAGDTVVEEHVESPGQEEIYIVLRGKARLEIGDETIEASAGNAIFVPNPDTRRGGIALEDDTVVLAVGGWRGQAYHSLPWEPIYLAQEAIRKGDWTAAAETLEREAGEHRKSAIIQFRLACCYAQLGQEGRAFEELGKAIDANPDIRDRAATEATLSSLSKLDEWLASRP